MIRSVSRRELFRHLVVRERPHADVRLPQPLASPPLVTPVGHFLARATFGPTPAAIAALQQKGLDAWLEQQLDPDAIDDIQFESLLPGIVAPTSVTAADIRMLAGAIYSKRQLQWRLAYFLNNHFATYRGATQGISETQEDDLFRKNCFGSFATLLRISAMSPAMIDFLDSKSNIAGNPNENYARELMELHTLGVTGGYSESDVVVVARVFTGWNRTNTAAGGAGTVVTSSKFRFVASQHDSTAKSTSFGWSTPGISGANGYQEGLSLLDFLAAHASTATYFTTKLCRYFVSDTPPAGLLARVRQAFVSSHGSMKATVRAIFHDPEFASAANVRAKVHDGFEVVANVMRRFEVPTTTWATLNTQVGRLRAQPHQFPVPTGYPEIGPAWQGAGTLLPRWKFFDDLVQNRIGNTRVPWTTLYGTGTPQSGTPQGGAAWVAALLERLVETDVPPAAVLGLTLYMNARLQTLPNNPTLNQQLPHVRDLASLILRLPEMQLQ